jgi:hypothetical protein
VLYHGLTLTWAGYDDIVGGVERAVPSHCGQRVCPPGYGGARCEQLQVDKVRKNTNNCITVRKGKNKSIMFLEYLLYIVYSEVLKIRTEAEKLVCTTSVAH